MILMGKSSISMDHFPVRYVNHFLGPPDWAQISPVGFPLAVLDVARPGVRQLSVGHRQLLLRHQMTGWMGVFNGHIIGIQMGYNC